MFSLFLSAQQKDKSASEKQRNIKGVMRVGLLSKGLLLRGDTDVRLVVVCEKYPTKELLERVYKILLQKIEVNNFEIFHDLLFKKQNLNKNWIQ